MSAWIRPGAGWLVLLGLILCVGCEAGSAPVDGDFQDGDAEDGDRVDGDTTPDLDGDEEPQPQILRARVVTFNTGTTDGMPYEQGLDDGYGPEQAQLSDRYYGNGLAWMTAVESVRRFFAALQADVVVFQEIFDARDCAEIPAEARTGFYCEGWTEGSPSVAGYVLGEGWQVMCHMGKPDKCAAVKRSFGRFVGCEMDFCLEGLDGARVEGCGGGSRIGRGLIELSAGGTLTLVNVHGSSGIKASDRECRRRQFEQVFVDFLNGEPAANGPVNLIMGDFNTDPHYMARSDESAARLLDFVGEGKPFHFLTEYGADALPTYALFNIDHVISDRLFGSCVVPGVTEGHPPVYEGVYFDHVPIVCDVEQRGE